MKTYPAPYNFELIVLGEDEKPYESEGRYFIDGPYNIVKTEMIEVTPLDQLNEQQAHDLAPKYEINDNGTPFTWYGDKDYNREFADEWLEWYISQLLQSEGLTLRVGERPEDVQKGVCEAWPIPEYTKRVQEQQAWDSAIPQNRILLKLK